MSRATPVVRIDGATRAAVAASRGAELRIDARTTTTIRLGAQGSAAEGTQQPPATDQAPTLVEFEAERSGWHRLRPTPGPGSDVATIVATWEGDAPDTSPAIAGATRTGATLARDGGCIWAWLEARGDSPIAAAVAMAKAAGRAAAAAEGRLDEWGKSRGIAAHVAEPWLRRIEATMARAVWLGDDLTSRQTARLAGFGSALIELTKGRLSSGEVAAYGELTDLRQASALLVMQSACGAQLATRDGNSERWQPIRARDIRTEVAAGRQMGIVPATMNLVTIELIRGKSESGRDRMLDLLAESIVSVETAATTFHVVTEPQTRGVPLQWAYGYLHHADSWGRVEQAENLLAGTIRAARHGRRASGKTLARLARTRAITDAIGY